MNSRTDIDSMRVKAIQGVARTEIFFRLCLGVAVLVEAAGLFGLLYFTDFSDRTHRLILMQTLLVYGTLAMGIIAIGILVRQSTLRVLSAMEPRAAD